MDLTDGVVALRPPVADDAPSIADAVQSSLATLSTWMPWATPGYSSVDALEWMDFAHAAGRHLTVNGDWHDALLYSVIA